MNGNGELIHRYTFTKIFRPETNQAELFAEMVRSKLSTQFPIVKCHIPAVLNFDES